MQCGGIRTSAGATKGVEMTLLSTEVQGGIVEPDTGKLHRKTAPPPTPDPSPLLQEPRAHALSASGLGCSDWRASAAADHLAGRTGPAGISGFCEQDGKSISPSSGVCFLGALRIAHSRTLTLSRRQASRRESVEDPAYLPTITRPAARSLPREPRFPLHPTKSRLRPLYRCPLPSSALRFILGTRRRRHR